MTIDQKLSTAELLYKCALRMGLRPAWIIPGRLFAISTPLGERYLYDAKSTINSQLSSNLTRNKLTTRLIMQRCGLPNIAFLNTADRAEAEQFLATHKKIIIKPLTGSNSHDVRIVDAAAQLAHTDLADYILEQYIAGTELRYLVLDNKIVGVHESKYGDLVTETRYLERISYPEAEWDPALVDLALHTASALHLRYAAVDYLIDSEGKTYILEVNSSPGMKWFHAPTKGPVVDIARLFLEAMVDDMPPAPAPAFVPKSLGAYPSVAYS